MAFTRGISHPSANPSASRLLSALEFLFGAFIVIGDNIFQVVPNEVIVLSIVGLVSIRLRDGRWSAMGLKRPSHLSNCAGGCCSSNRSWAIRN